MAALNILGIGDEEQQRNLLGIPGAQVLNLSPPKPEDEPDPTQTQNRDALANLYNGVTGMIDKARSVTWDDVIAFGKSLLPTGQSLGEFGAGGMDAWADRDIVVPEGAEKVMLDTGQAYKMPDGSYKHRDELPRRSAVVPLSREDGKLVASMPGVLGQLPALGSEGATAALTGPARVGEGGVVLGAGSAGPRAARAAKAASEATPSGFSVDTSVLSPNAGTLVGKLGGNADIQLDALGLPSYRDIVPSTRTGPLTEAQLRAGAPKGEVFDLSETHRVPEVEQRDLDRIDPTAGRRKGLPAHITAAIEDPELAAKLRFVAEKGADVGGAYWYNTEPLRHAFIKELGEKEGNEVFKRYVSIVGATSAGSEVGQNVRAASYYQHKERLGEPVQSSKDLISPYGHKMQQAHVSGYLGLGEHGEGTTLNPQTQPKRSSFVENLGGNQQPVTIDKHNVRLIGMLSKNPDFLNTTTVADVNYPKLGIVKGESRNWRDEVKSGRITMDQAIEHPHMWQDTPDPVHYGALEAWQQKLAKEMGLTPAQFQAALWVGGGRVTGLRSLPISFMGIVENRLAQTAAKRNITPEQALQDWIRNKAPLLSVGAGGGGLLGLPSPGEEARQ